MFSGKQLAQKRQCISPPEMVQPYDFVLPCLKTAETLNCFRHFSSHLQNKSPGQWISYFPEVLFKDLAHTSLCCECATGTCKPIVKGKCIRAHRQFLLALE